MTYHDAPQSQGDSPKRRMHPALAALLTAILGGAVVLLVGRAFGQHFPGIVGPFEPRLPDEAKKIVLGDSNMPAWRIGSEWPEFVCLPGYAWRDNRLVEVDGQVIVRVR